MWFIGLFVVTLTGVLGHTVPFPPKCSRSDSACLTQVAQEAVPTFTAGIPDLGIEPLDPYELKNYTTDLAGLLFSTHGTARGYKNSKLYRVSFDPDNILRIDTRVDMSLKGKYKAAGQLLFLPIQGDGDIKIKTVNCIVNLTAPYEIITDSDSKQHIHIKKFDMKFDIIGNTHFTLTNLFNGNKQLSDAMHDFLNTNWKLVSNEFAAPVVKTGIDQMFKRLNKLLAQYSVDEMFL